MTTSSLKGYQKLVIGKTKYNMFIVVKTSMEKSVIIKPII